ncbi:prepilin peptidase [Dickeya fangzhongdai]|uniref:prepilin peptidase n=1 Tax=Dickeya fangzhongdai TaxID=1778540 RepID=UPI00137059A0|nr:prepilin peptidase [Dickeya fangzhongdai]UMB77367.1 prepilin peptidase [Dickeya fangzhongdai]
MTLITLALPWPLMVPIFVLSLTALMAVSGQVHYFLAEQHSVELWCRRTALRYAWLHAGVLTLIIMAPTDGMTRLLWTFFCLFVFRMSLTDRLSGWLPSDFTWSCLLAGILAAVMQSQGLVNLAAAAVLVCASALLRCVGSRYAGQEVIGLGDVWLTGALGAWLGWMPALQALLAGTGGFVLWQLAGRQSHGGPLGPWLCWGGQLLMLQMLYQPLLTW